MNLKELESRFEEIEDLDYDETDIHELQDKVYKLEEEVQDAVDFSLDPNEKQEFQNLLKKILRYKDENDFFDPISERAFMHPNDPDED